MEILDVSIPIRTRMPIWPGNAGVAVRHVEAIADGALPCTVGDRLLGYADSTSAYVVRDVSGKILNTIRFNSATLTTTSSARRASLVGLVTASLTTLIRGVAAGD